MKLIILLLIASINSQNVWAQQETAELKTTILSRDQQLEQMIRQGEAKWLNDGNAEFLSLFCASLIDTKGSMLWLAAPNQTILSHGVMQSICDYYPTVGWQILSLAPAGLDFSGPNLVATSTSGSDGDTAAKPSLMLAKNEAWYEAQDKDNLAAIVSRLSPAENEILATNSRYVLVANSASASIALEAINTQQIKPSAVVLLNVMHPNDPQQSRINAQIKALTIPVLDIYHINTKPAAAKRLRFNKGGNYKQVMVTAMQNDFRGAEQQVLSRIESWLKKLK